LKKFQDEGTVAIHTKNMTHTHRERLLRNGFIKEVMNGWYIPARPEEPAGESTVALVRRLLNVSAQGTGTRKQTKKIKSTQMLWLLVVTGRFFRR